MMHVVVIYDIPHDGMRALVAEACLDYGLDRVQYSSFYGRLGRNHQEELMILISQILGERPGKVELIPVCERDWQSRLCLE